MRAIRLCLSAFLAVVAFDSAAVTLYKWIDRDGRVTYGDQIPPGVRGGVVALDIDTTANPPQPPAVRGLEPLAQSENEQIIRRRPVNDDAEVRLARQRAEDARRALEAAQNNSTAEDWIYFGPNNPLGMRRAPKPEYAALLNSLETQVKDAEAALAEAERRYRLAF